MIGLFFEWYFFEIPGKIKKIWGNYLWFFGRYFAIGDLAREFFAPWKGMTFAREKRNFEIGDALGAWGGNLFSRLIGAVMRTFFLAAGIAAEAAALVAGVAAFIIWPLLFLLIPFSLILGIMLLAV
ncbi:MAG: hypothetical protein WCX69_00025 [Candidatus Paceibacterota bacterium]